MCFCAVAVAEYDAPSADNRAPSASESGDHSEPDSGDDVSNLPPSARAGQADVNPTRQASPALDLSASETEPLEGVDVAIEPQPDDVSADDADGASADDAVDVSAGNDSVSASVETAGIGSGAPEVETSAADVTGVSELERAADGAQTDGLVSGAELQTDGIPAGAERGVKETEGDTLRAASTPEGEKPEEALGGSSEEKTSGGRLPVVLTPETGSAAERASSPLRPRKLHFADIDAGREEAPVEKSVEQSSGGVRERSSNSLPKSLTPLCGGLGSESSGEFEIEGEVRARMSAKTDDVAVGSMGGDQNGQSQEDLTESESEEDAAASEPVESAKKQRKKDLLAKLKSLQEVKSQLRAREVYLAGELKPKHSLGLSGFQFFLATICILKDVCSSSEVCFTRDLVLKRSSGVWRLVWGLRCFLVG